MSWLPKELDNRLSVLTEKLMPAEGPAESSEGELIRAVNRILYRYFNDGDYWYKGYGIETAGGAAAFIRKYKDFKFSELIQKSKHKKGKDYEQALIVLAEWIVDYVESKSGKYQTNEIDMLDLTPRSPRNSSY